MAKDMTKKDMRTEIRNLYREVCDKLPAPQIRENVWWKLGYIDIKAKIESRFPFVLDKDE